MAGQSASVAFLICTVMVGEASPDVPRMPRGFPIDCLRMRISVIQGLPRWTLVVPPLVFVDLLLTWHRHLGAVLLIFVCLGLGAAVIAAVHHAEVAAHRVGEPFGTLIL